MNGAQDLGGMMGFGPVEREPDEPWFHAKWERRAFGLTLAMGATGTWNLDTARHARETLPPVEYLSSSYYEIWFKGLEKLVQKAGLVTEDELRIGHALQPPAPIARVLMAADVPTSLAHGSPTDRPATAPARFAVGDRVITRNMQLADSLKIQGTPAFIIDETVIPGAVGFEALAAAVKQVRDNGGCKLC